MRLVPDTTGRFAKRPHYEPAELDRECELLVSGFLKAKHGRADYPVCTDDLATFIEREAQDLDLYADLSEYGTGVEGITIFLPGSRPKVKIDRTLSENETRRNRLRTTLTHEFGHVHFHAYLFDEKAKSVDLFQANPGNPDTVQVCKRETILDARQSDWMEWQAGHVCGAILMPASVVRRFVKETVVDLGDIALTALEGKLIAAMMHRFEVSAEAARVRLGRLGLVTSVTPDRALFE